MLRNYLLIGLRSLQKHLSYALLNISGLALGLATCLLLVTWIRHELSYDTFHEKSERIYRVSLEYSFGGQVARTSVSPNALLPALTSLAETESAVRLYNPSLKFPYVVNHPGNVFEEKKFYFADSTFFDIFSFELIQGNPEKVLTQPFSVILTERTALKYFGATDPVGKTLFINNEHDYKVTGIMRNPPSNSLLQFDFVASFNSLPAGRDQPTWWSANYQTFVLLHPKAALGSLVDKTNAIAHEAVGAELTGRNDYVRYNFLPLTDIYLRSQFQEPETVSDIQYVYIFSAVTVLILIIACINYVNLATARSSGRAREVGIRKVSGALRKQLFLQFISESLVITAIAFALAFLIAVLLLPFFNQLTGKNFSYDTLFSGDFILLCFAGFLATGLIAGAYPAIALTRFNPVRVLKGNFQQSASGLVLRKGLVVVQFGISVVLITGTLMVMEQLRFIRHKKLGFDRENTIVLPLDARTEKVFETLRTEIKRRSAALQVGRGSESPAKVEAGYGMKRADEQGEGIIVRGLLADEEYITALGMQLSAGRNFTKDDVDRLTRDTVFTFILNESALAALFIPEEEAVGTKVSLQGREGEIVGVVKDFHFSSLHDAIGPLAIFPQERFRKMFIKLPAGDLPQQVESLRRIYRDIVPHRPFEFEFLDEQYASLYTAEERMGSVAAVFSALAIFIACLGLFGLVSYSAEQRRKEIGIRKVLGASAAGIMLLITRDFSRLVAIAICAGLPLAYWLTTEMWLEEFAYKADIGYVPFLFSSLVCVCVALASTTWQAIRAAAADPAETLRSE